MSKSVWKYAFENIGGEQVLQVPEGATPLFVAVQAGTPCLWFEVDESQDKETRTFEWHGTGHRIPSDGREHLGSVLLADGALVFHLYEVPK